MCLQGRTIKQGSQRLKGGLTDYCLHSGCKLKYPGKFYPRDPDSVGLESELKESVVFKAPWVILMRSPTQERLMYGQIIEDFKCQAKVNEQFFLSACPIGPFF